MHTLWKSIAVTAVAVTVVLSTRSALACDKEFETAYDLHDRATTVVLVKVDTLKGNTATLTVVETFKGNPGSTLTLEVDVRSTCSPGLKAGKQGVIFLDDDDDMLGAFDGFQRAPAIITALRGYRSSVAADRAKALLAVATGGDWSPSYGAAHALANRPDLVQALDAKAKQRVIERAGKLIKRQHPLLFVAARLHDAGVPKLYAKRPRNEDDAKLLVGVVANKFQSETDAAKLADTIKRDTASTIDRVAAMERCEKVHGSALARFTQYSSPGAQPDWMALAAACRSGKPI